MEHAVYLTLGGLLFPLALYGMFARRHLIMKIIAVNIAASAAFLFLLVAAPPTAGGGADPVPQAMVLTGIVVSVCITAFALSIVRRLVAQGGAPRLGHGDDE